MRVQPAFPPFHLFRDACQSGLSVIRPLTPAARTRDAEGWNYGAAKSPSYEAYGRMRALVTLTEALKLKPKRVLEVAAGDAALSACLQMQGAEVVANDLRADVLRQNLSKFVNGRLISIAPGNVFDLGPDRLGLFDLVVACEVIEHVAHPDHLLSHLSAFLSKDGTLFLTTPNGDFFRNTLQTYADVKDATLLEDRQFLPDADGHLFLITPAEIESLAALAELKVDSLAVWGTPILSGSAGLARFSRFTPLKLSYLAETFCQHLPAELLDRVTNSLVVRMSHKQKQ